MKKVMILCTMCLMGISAMAEDVDAVKFVQGSTTDWYMLSSEPTVTVGTTITIDGKSYNLYDGDVFTTFGKVPVHPTKLESVDDGDSQHSDKHTVHKFLHKGHFYIRKNNKLYNATGIITK